MDGQTIGTGRQSDLGRSMKTMWKAVLVDARISTWYMHEEHCPPRLRTLRKCYAQKLEDMYFWAGLAFVANSYSVFATVQTH